MLQDNVGLLAVPMVFHVAG